MVYAHLYQASLTYYKQERLLPQRRRHGTVTNRLDIPALQSL